MNRKNWPADGQPLGDPEFRYYLANFLWIAISGMSNPWFNIAGQDGDHAAKWTAWNQAQLGLRRELFAVLVHGAEITADLLTRALAFHGEDLTRKPEGT